MGSGVGVGPVVDGLSDGLQIDFSAVLVFVPDEFVVRVDFEYATVAGLESYPVEILTELF